MKIGKLMQAQCLLWHLPALSQSALLFLKPGLHTNLGCFRAGWFLREQNYSYKPVENFETIVLRVNNSEV